MCFWAITNDHQFLKDKSGNRRFLPVEVGINPLGLPVCKIAQGYVNQIWAEAKHYYDSGYSIYLNKEEIDIVRTHQQLSTDASPLEGMVRNYLEIHITDDWYKKTTFVRRNYIQTYGNNLIDK